VPAIGEAVSGSVEVDDLGGVSETDGGIGWTNYEDLVDREGEHGEVEVERNGLEGLLEMARIPQPEREGGVGGEHRATRTGYGLRPSSVLREPQRLAFLVSKIVGATLEAMGWDGEGLGRVQGMKAP
jgi:hypothetical protein